MMRRATQAAARNMEVTNVAGWPNFPPNNLLEAENFVAKINMRKYVSFFPWWFFFDAFGEEVLFCYVKTVKMMFTQTTKSRTRVILLSKSIGAFYVGLNNWWFSLFIHRFYVSLAPQLNCSSTITYLCIKELWLKYLSVWPLWN
jgi:hypothetical protein